MHEWTFSGSVPFNMSSQQSFMLILLALSMCLGHDSTYYCGRNLARAIAMYCSQTNMDKRSDGTMYNSILAPYYKDQDDSQYGSLWPHYKTTALSLPSRGKRLVVDECCNKPCSVSELQSYCY